MPAFTNRALGLCSFNAHSATPSTFLLIVPQLRTGTPTLDEPAFDGDFCEVVFNGNGAGLGCHVDVLRFLNRVEQQVRPPLHGTRASLSQQS